MFVYDDRGAAPPHQMLRRSLLSLLQHDKRDDAPVGRKKQALDSHESENDNLYMRA
jgi:hypothetical protein